MIYPYLTYCNINLLGYVLVQIIRVMTFSTFREETRPLFENLGKLNIYELNTYLIASFMYSRYHDKLPDVFNSYFVTNDNIHSYNMRSASKIHIDFKRTNYGKFSLKYRGATPVLYGTAYQMI